VPKVGPIPPERVAYHYSPVKHYNLGYYDTRRCTTIPLLVRWSCFRKCTQFKHTYLARDGHVSAHLRAYFLTLDRNLKLGLVDMIWI
jgi:hypothetical protein